MKLFWRPIRGLFWFLASVLTPTALIYALCRYKNAQVGHQDPSFFSFLEHWASFSVPGDASTDDMMRDLKLGFLHSFQIFVPLFLSTLFFALLLGIALYQLRHRKKLQTGISILTQSLSLVPPFLIYYLCLSLGLLEFSGERPHGWFLARLEPGLGPYFIFGFFNSCLAIFSTQIRDNLEDLFQRLFIRFYVGKGASFFQLLREIKTNWLYPFLRLALYFTPFLLVESIIFEFLFRIYGSGKMLWNASSYSTELGGMILFTPKLVTLTFLVCLVVQGCNSLSRKMEKGVA